ncbi:hypothetical protein PMALA_022420 [Plasmodium malariae]|nr:hypothetical protein PMALA_022420 [Plasmodium malariae]
MNFDNNGNDVNINNGMSYMDSNSMFNEGETNYTYLSTMKNFKKKDKIKKEKKNTSINKSQTCTLNTTRKKKFGNNGPPTAEKLSELLYEQNMSVPQIAAIYGVHRTTVARWCHNRKIIQKSSHYQGRRRTSTKLNNEYI